MSDKDEDRPAAEEPLGTYRRGDQTTEVTTAVEAVNLRAQGWAPEEKKGKSTAAPVITDKK